MTSEPIPDPSQKGDASMTLKMPDHGWTYCGWLVLLLLAGCSTGRTSEKIPGVNIADAALDGGMPETALNVTRSILQSNPRDVGALERQGTALAQLGQPDAAIEAWRRALAVNPAAPVALLGLGRMQLSRGSAADAERRLHEVAGDHARTTGQR